MHFNAERTLEVLHRQIAFTELSFKPFSGKFVTIVPYPKKFVECLNPHFIFMDILPMTKSVILATIMT